MDSQVLHSRVHESDQHHGTDEHHHDPEKKSVLKKVKAKAKKIKDTIKKHAHHDHDHEDHYEDQHIPDDHDLDEEDDEDEDMVEDPDVHGAPIYESTVARSVIPPDEQGHHHQEPKAVVVSPDVGTDQMRANDSTLGTFVAEEGNAVQRKVNLQRPIDLEEDPAAPGSTRQPASNYQSKVTDPTGAGGGEKHITPVLESFTNNVHDEPKPNPEPNVVFPATQSPSGAAEIHVTPVEKAFAKIHVHDEPRPYAESNVLSTGTQYPSGASEMHEEQKHYESMDKPSNESRYTDKISSATTAIADKAIDVKNAVASKLSYDNENKRSDHEKETRHGENQSSYTQKISSATSVIADKAITAKNAIVSKLGYDDNKGNEDHENKTRHGDNQSSYTEKISSATSTIADKAVYAKNAVTSKLGYGGGGGGDNVTTTTNEDHLKSQDANASGMSGTSTAEHGKKITDSLTEKLAPVYGKVAGVGTAVKSRLSGTTSEADKGVSVKDYFAEKLRPGDEDRALSEVISEALYKREGEAGTKVGGDHEERRMTDVISDVIHERDEGIEGEGGAEHRQLGKVTESEEVQRRLGSDNETEGRYQESYENSSGKGVVDKLKDYTGSWFGKAQENQSSQEAGRVDQGERRLQESSN